MADLVGVRASGWEDGYEVLAAEGGVVDWAVECYGIGCGDFWEFGVEERPVAIMSLVVVSMIVDLSSGLRQGIVQLPLP